MSALTAHLLFCTNTFLFKIISSSVIIASLSLLFLPTPSSSFSFLPSVCLSVSRSDILTGRRKPQSSFLKETEFLVPIAMVISKFTSSRHQTTLQSSWVRRTPSASMPGTGNRTRHWIGLTW